MNQLLNAKSIRFNGPDSNVEVLLNNGKTEKFLGYYSTYVTPIPFTVASEVAEIFNLYGGNEWDDHSLVRAIVSRVYETPEVLKNAILLSRHECEWDGFAYDDDGNCCVTIRPKCISPFAIALIKGKSDGIDCYHAYRIMG